MMINKLKYILFDLCSSILNYTEDTKYKQAKI